MLAWITGYSAPAPRALVVIEDIRADHAGPFPTVDDYVRTVEQCDVLFFSGSSGSSWITRLGGACMWSHVGMGYVDPGSGMRFVWESQRAHDTCIDVLSNMCGKPGPRLVPMAQRIIEYARSREYARELPDGTRLLDIGLLQFATSDPTAYERFATYQTAVSSASFEQSKLAMIKAQYSPLFGGNVRDTTEIYCSQLVVETLSAIGALTPEASSNANNETPSSLSRHLLPCRSGYRLGPMLYITRVAVKRSEWDVRVT